MVYRSCGQRAQQVVILFDRAVTVSNVSYYSGSQDLVKSEMRQ